MRAAVLRGAATISALLLLNGCSEGLDTLIPDLGITRPAPHGVSSQVSALWQEDTIITVRGVLTGLGGDPSQCIRLRQSDTEGYALVGNPGDFRENERVQVTGPISRWSTCDSYRVIRIDRIGPVPD